MWQWIKDFYTEVDWPAQRSGWARTATITVVTILVIAVIVAITKI